MVGKVGGLIRNTLGTGTGHDFERHRDELSHPIFKKNNINLGNPILMSLWDATAVNVVVRGCRWHC